MIDFIEYVVSELKSKRLSKENALSLIKQYSHQSTISTSTPVIHPLLHNNTSDFSQQCYTSTFNGEESFLKDHQVNGEKILPGVAYLEMARAAVERALPFRPESSALKLQKNVWAHPIMVSENKNVSIALFANEMEIKNSQIGYEVYTIQNDDSGGEEEIIHFQGQAIFVNNIFPEKIDLEYLKSQMNRGTLEAVQIYEAYSKMGINYGPSHQGIKTIFKGEYQLLAKLSLNFNESQSEYLLHPGIMDSALQSSIGMLPDFEVLPDHPSVPFSLESLQYFSPCKNEMFAWIRYSSGCKLEDKVSKLDIDLCDINGNVCIQLRAFTSRVISSDFSTEGNKSVKRSLLYATQTWEAASVTDIKEIYSTKYEKKYVIIDDNIINDINKFKKWLPQCNSLSMQSLFKSNEKLPPFSAVALGIFEFIKERIKSKPQSKVLIQIILPNLDDLSYIGLSGLIKTAALENPQITGQIIFVTPQMADEDLAKLINENQGVPLDTVIRYESGSRKILKLQEIRPVRETPYIPFKDQGVYLITGGLGALGYLFSKEILNKSESATIILTGRSTLDPAKKALLDKLLSGKSRLIYQQTNLNDIENVKKLIQTILHDHGQLNGIIHSAGTISDNFILRKSSDEFIHVLEPKVTGTVNLDIATANIDLDFLVLFSSGVSITGNNGQADYAAGNGFMDHFAIYRNQLAAKELRRGKTLSINWPLWQDGGMKIDPATQELMQKNAGIYPMMTLAGIQAFYNSLEMPYSQVMVVEGDLTKIRQLLFTDPSVNTYKVKQPVQVESVFSYSPVADLDAKVLDFLKKQCSIVLKIPLNKIEPDSPLEKYGIDSILAMNLTGQLEKTFGTLPKTLFFEYQTISELSKYFIKNFAEKLSALFSKTETTLVKTNERKEHDAYKERKTETSQVKKIIKQRLRPVYNNSGNITNTDPIAVIGLSGRYPESANIEEYWQNLRDGKDCVTEVPKDRWDWRKYYDETRSKAGYHYSKWGGFISGVDEFDPKFFNISPREAAFIDPQERLFLQHAWMAIEDAGYTRTALQIPNDNDLAGQVGVYVGVMYGEYNMSGSLASIANRVSYVLNLHGPSMTLDTMCSSSLTAIHLACQDLKNGKTNLAIAGGVNVSVHPNKYSMLSAGLFISSAGHCQSFGEGGDGYIPGEGVGVVILKRLSEAVKDGNHIYGIIRATALNHGGKTNGYTVPNPKAQAAVINKALSEANINPRHISYIEAHGTGTKLGDPIEIAALSQAFGRNTSDTQFCLIGSAKSNIGHCESAAGIAGITKVLLQMKYHKIVPSLHSKKLNPNIDFEVTPFIVNQTLQNWEQPIIDGQKIPRLAGVSSFGAGGSNAHIILQEYVPVEEKHIIVNPDEKVILPLSARTPDQLRQKAVDLLNFIKKTYGNWGKAADLVAMAYTLQICREANEERLAVIVNSFDDLTEKLQTFINSESGIDDTYLGQAKRSKELLSIISGDEDFQETIEKWMAARKLSKLAELWVNGIDIEWIKLYGIDKIPILSLPTYPFAKERYWIDPKSGGFFGSPEKIKNDGDDKRFLHPLLHANISDLSGLLFRSYFTGKEKFIQDYQLCLENESAQTVFPAVTFLEMAYNAVKISTPFQQDNVVLKLSNLVIGAPLIFKKPENFTLSLYSDLSEDGNNVIEFEIGAVGDDKDFIYCQGNSVFLKSVQNPKIDINKLRLKMLDGKADAGKLNKMFKKLGMHYGQYYQNISTVYYGQKQLLAEINLSSHSGDFNEFTMHPALLNSIIQVCISLIVETNISYRPLILLSMDSLVVMKACQKEMFAWVRYADNVQREHSRIEVDLFDMAGEICIKIHGLVLLELADSIVDRSTEVKSVIAEHLELQTSLVLDKIRSIKLPELANLPLKSISGTIAKPNSIQLIGAQVIENRNERAGGASGNASMPAGIKDHNVIYRKEESAFQSEILTKEQLQEELSASLAQTLYLDKSEIDKDKSFIDLGLDSIVGVEWVKAINKRYGLDLSSTKVYDYSNIKALASFLEKEIGKSPIINSEKIQLSEVKNIELTSLHLNPKNRTTDVFSNSYLQESLRVSLAKALYLDSKEIDINKSFIDLGLDSIVGVEWVKAINEEFDLELSATKIYDYSTIKSLASFLEQELGNENKPVAKIDSTADQRIEPNIQDPSIEEEDSHLTTKKLQEQLKVSLSKALYLDPSQVDINKSFVDLGLDSIVGVEWIKEINNVYSLDLSVTKVYDYSTINALTEYLKKEIKKVPDFLHKIPSATGIETALQSVDYTTVPSQTGKNYTKDYIQEQLKTSLAKALFLNSSEIQIDKSFTDLGLDSIVGVEWVKSINNEFDIELSATKVYDYSNISLLTSFLLSQLQGKTVKAIQQKETVNKVEPQTIPTRIDSIAVSSFINSGFFPVLKSKKKTRVKEVTQVNHTGSGEKIAIVGMSGRYPQAPNLRQYWNNLVEGRNSIIEIPSSRWDINKYFDPDPAKPGKMYCKWMGMLEDAEYFDPLFFQISPSEAESMDPQHRLFLQESYRAFEDAGYSANAISNTKCGVYLGIMSSEYSFLLSKNANSNVNITGNSFAIGAGRVAYFLNLKGPAIPFDTACSSSLVAIHVACQGLINREIDMALAGGVSLYLIPESYVGMCQAGMLSPEGQCKTFDDLANGFVPGEGVGAVVLKRLQDAERDNDNIYGVILGSAINQDGKTNGITAPNVNSQIELERELYEKYKINPETISYVETHGTGTKLGDPIELEALSTVFKEKTSKKEFCAIGSVKTNIGHTSGAAGVASIQKVLLSMKYKTLVPSLNIKKENAIFDFSKSPFYISREKKSWDVNPGTKRRAAISSFGFSGTNAHLVIEEYIPSQKVTGQKLINKQKIELIVPLSARSFEQLKQRAIDLVEYISIATLNKDANFDEKLDLSSISYTLQMGREPMKERLGVVVNSIEQLREKLQAFIAGQKNIDNLFIGRAGNDKDTLSIFGADADLQKVLSKWISEKKHNKLIELWVKGIDIDWNKLWEVDKPQRTSLPTYPFAKGKYWVDVAEVDSNNNPQQRHDFKKNPVPKEREELQKLYFHPEWKESALKDMQHEISGPVMVIDSEEKLFEIIKKQLTGVIEDNELIFVKYSDTYKKIAANKFTINPEDSDCFSRLIKDLNDNKILPKTIIHQCLETADIEKANDIKKLLSNGIYSIFSLCKTLMGQKSHNSLRIISIFTRNDILSSSVNSAFGGFYKTLSLENPGYRAKIVEIQNKSDDVEKHINEKAGIILNELKEQDWKKIEILYKNGNDSQSIVRFARAVEPFSPIESREVIPFKQNGTYIISGGMGGLGLIISEYLVKTYNAKLVLFGRSALNDENQRKINKLKSFNSDILYLQADVSKIEDMEMIVNKTKEKFKQINGIIHSAGINRDAFIIRKTKEEIENVLESKMYGAINLDRATIGEHIDLFIMFSSIAGIMGNLGQCDYAFGNNFLDSFAENRDLEVKCGKRFGKTLSINWPYWEKGGMKLSENDIVFTKKQAGLFPLPIDVGIEFLEQLLKTGNRQSMPLYGEPSKIKAYVAHELTKETVSQAISNKDTATLIDKAIEYVKSLLGKELKLSVDQIDIQERFESFGIDSIIVNRLNVTLADELGELPKTLFYEFSTVEELARYLANECSTALEKYYKIEQTYEQIDSSGGYNENNETISKLEPGDVNDSGEPIAIIGIHGLFPQSSNLEEFWENLKNGRDLVDLVPADRWDYKKYYNPDPEKAEDGKIYCKWGGFLADVDKFDPQFFNINSEEARIMDPQERLFIESVWAAFEDAGYTRDSLKKKYPKAKSADVGVFVGVTTNTYNLLATEEWNRGNVVTLGAMPWSIANRVSYLFDFKGPSIPIDTACSSSLVAIHLACESLKKQECQVAVAGGVNLYLHPSKYHSFCKRRMLALNGRCRSFGSGDDGFVPGEGIGSVILKPLSNAIKDGDHIYAIVAGSAYDHSGRSNGYSAPNPNSQAELISSTLKKSGVPPESISYIEGHGTGTQLGDSLEIVSLTQVFGKPTPKTQYCSIGSVKTNIGHSESAAGIAGVAKVVLQLKYRQLVPSLHSEQVNPNIRLNDTPFYLQHSLEEWIAPSGYPRRALINSFGAGGVNACVLLEEYAKSEPRSALLNSTPHLAILSAKNYLRLRESVNNLIQKLRKDDDVDLVNLCYTLQTGREAMKERLAIVVSEKIELIESLNDWCNNKISANILYSKSQQKLKISKKEEDELISELIQKKDMFQIAKYWVTGTEIDWENLYDTYNKPLKISLPAYPFEKERYWVSDKFESELPETKKVNSVQIHPLISFNSSTLREISFSSLLSDKEFYAIDHMINDEKVFPGSGFLEMACISGNIAGEQKVAKIQDVVWAQPLSFKRGPNTVQTSLKPKGESVEFSISSFDEYNQKKVHSEGRLLFEQAGTGHVDEEIISLDGIREKCKETESGAFYYELFRKHGFNYGPTFQTIGELSTGDSIALSKLKLSESLKKNSEQYILHPSLIDGALQTVAGLIGSNGNKTPYLPFAIDEVQLFRPLPQICYAFVVSSDNNESYSKDYHKFNIQILNENGNVLVRFKNFYARALHSV